MDAICVARRLIEHIRATQDRVCYFCAWIGQGPVTLSPQLPRSMRSKDSFPTHVHRVVDVVSSHWRSQVQVGRQMLSTWRPEHGISQGCVACHFDGSVFLHDTDMDVRSRGLHSFPAALVTDLVYAADTLVVVGEQDRAHELHRPCRDELCIYFQLEGLEPVRIRCPASILKPSQRELLSKQSSASGEAKDHPNHTCCVLSVRCMVCTSRFMLRKHQLHHAPQQQIVSCS